MPPLALASAATRAASLHATRVSSPAHILARMAACPAPRSGWLSTPSRGEVRYVRRTLRGTPLFMADAFAPALLLHHPPSGLRDWGLRPRCNITARQVSRSGDCDVLRMAEEFVRNATTPPTPKRFGRCAVVGSGSQLGSSKLGTCIDGHDAVLRLNDAPVKVQHAEDVGWRTTWRLSTMQSWVDAVKRRSPDLRADAQLLYCLEPWVGKCHYIGLSGRFGGRGASMINPEMVGQVQTATFALAQKVAQSAHDWQYNKLFGYDPRPPTTGMLAIFAALSTCDQVNAFGLTVNVSTPPPKHGCAKYYVGRKHHGRLCMTPAEYFGKEGARVRSPQRQPTPAAAECAPQIAVGSVLLAPCPQVYHTHLHRFALSVVQVFITIGLCRFVPCRDWESWAW